MTNPVPPSGEGSSTASLVLRLVLLSLLVGVVLAVFDLTPWRLLHLVQRLFEELIGTGIEAVYRILSYVVTGAAIVVPIWLILRLTSGRKS